ncbi:protein SLOW GREEN 1, chloroplastic [Elaeis guineensis]|uniref:Protein SLOW GREEN 1, chloroplastic n=1 Tax=Elaeis guineensis var. tenera TaxID=51953 RepID=A0A6I9RME5_ELAGV|nr:protein SLOW GREEN 1, chloroplastic [Elaeis guineensis]
MASLTSTSLSLHPKPSRLSILGFRSETLRTHSHDPPFLPKPFHFPVKTLTLILKSPDSRSPFLPRPISSVPNASCSRSPHCPHPHQRILWRICAEKAAVLLVGSLLFLGRFNGRPALALGDARRSDFSKPLEEKMDAREGKEDEEERYVKILERDPTDVEALKVVLYGKMRKGKTKEAVEYVERLIALEPDEVEWRLLQALSYELMGNLAKAKRLFKEILKERPLLLRALHGLALAMHKNHEGPAVFDMLNKALELARREKRVTEERNIKILIAQMHVVKGDLEGASKQFQDLINENPRDFRPYLCQGIIYSLLDRKKEADEQFEIYQSLIPDEFPQRSFIDDVILAAKTESQERFEKKFESEFSNRN